MCGKFTQIAAWSELRAYPEMLNLAAGGRVEIVTPMREASVLHLDEDGQRRMTRMRWGFSRQNVGERQERPEFIHARAETIDSRPTFRDAFLHRRGILPVRDFNEGRQISPARVEQHTITPEDGNPLGIAVIWERLGHGDGARYSFVMVTVPANALVGTITERMPAILPPEDWRSWLGEDSATPAGLKALLRPLEGKWRMAPEARAQKKPPSERGRDLFDF